MEEKEKIANALRQKVSELNELIHQASELGLSVDLNNTGSSRIQQTTLSITAREVIEY